MDNVERGHRLAELREAAGLLQRQVGAAFDIDKAAVSEWERGKSNPSRERLLALDVMYKAEGEVLRLFGVAPETGGLSRLERELRQEISELTLRVIALGEQSLAADQKLAARLDAVERLMQGQGRQAQ